MVSQTCEQARLAKQMPEAYGSVGVVEKSGEEDDEYDVMIRCLWKTIPFRYFSSGRERREIIWSRIVQKLKKITLGRSRSLG